MFGISKPLLTADDWFVPKPALEKSLEAQYGILAIMVILAAITVIYAIKTAKKNGRSDVLWITCGAALACFYEPLGDFLAHVTYHEVNTIAFTSAFGFTIPLWVLPTYVVFFGAALLWLLNEIEKGMTCKRWMMLFFMLAPSALVFEAPLLALGYIEYYGANQPVKILRYPPWMAFSNMAATLITATSLYFVCKTKLVRNFPAVLVMLTPLFIAGGSAATILPVGSALSSTDSTFIVNIFALVSIAVSCFFAWASGYILEEFTCKASVPAQPKAGAVGKPTEATG